MTVSINGVYSHTFKNGVLVKEALDPANETVNRGHYAATTLSAVDADLAAANIKSGENIFGFDGTVVAGALAEDVEGDVDIGTDSPGSGSFYKDYFGLSAESEGTLLTKNLTFDASSLAFACAFANAHEDLGTEVKFRLYMGGVLMQTSAYIPTESTNFILRDFKVLSGSQDCELRAYNEYVDTRRIDSYGKGATMERSAAIAVGSVKLA